jgi:tetratricopeptide (TPR) repeat protein
VSICGKTAWVSTVAAVLAQVCLARSARADGAADLVGIAGRKVEAGDLPGAVRDYSMALGLDPALDAAYAGLGRTRERMGQWAEAERVYEVGLSHAPGSVLLLRARGKLRWTTGDHPRGAEDLERAGTRDISALVELAGLYRAEGQPYAELAVWRRTLVLAQERTDGSTARVALINVRALGLVVAEADPVSHVVEPAPTRRLLRSIALR